MTTALDHIKKRCFVNAPWDDLINRYLDFFLENRIQPEIGLEGLCLYNEEHHNFEQVAAQFAKRGLACTLHAPFFDLTPGGLDPYLLEKTRDKYNMAFDLISVFKPRSIVCHLQFEDNKHGYVFDRWLAAALETWRPLVEKAGKYNVPVMFENTYEKDPSTHLTVLSKLDTRYAGFCLDTGHLLAFAKTTWQKWLPALLPRLGQMHLHDNNGSRDEHLAPGQGLFNFQGLFDFLKKNDCHPILTFEPHSEDALQHTFAYLESTGLINGI